MAEKKTDKPRQPAAQAGTSRKEAGAAAVKLTDCIALKPFCHDGRMFYPERQEKLKGAAGTKTIPADRLRLDPVWLKLHKDAGNVEEVK